MNKLGVECFFPWKKISATKMWNILANIAGANFGINHSCRLYGEEHAFSDVEEAIQTHKRTSFNIESAYGNFRYATVGNSGMSFLRIHGDLLASNLDAIHWVDEMSMLSSFVYGRAFDIEFDKWQNTSDLMSYELAGRSTDGLQWVNNGLPEPLCEEVIDISRNPGRRVFRERYIETVGHLMWFGDLFWKITNQNRRSPPKWVEQSKRIHGVDFITVSSQPFCENMSTRYKLLDSVREHYFPK